MSYGVALEAVTCFGTTGIALWELNTLEANAKKRPNSIVAFALVVAWGILAIWALALGLLSIKGADTTSMIAMFGATFVLAIITWSAKNVGLIDLAVRKFKNERDSQSSIDFITNTPVTDAGYVKVRRAEYSDIVGELEDQAVILPACNAHHDVSLADDNPVRPNRD